MAVVALGGMPWWQQPVVQRIDETLTVEARSVKANLPEQTVTYADGVKAIYGVTTVRADRLVIYLASNELEAPVLAVLGTANLVPGMHVPTEEIELNLATRRGVASGNVLLTDPDGTVRAERLEFNWMLGTGIGEKIEAD